MFKSCYSGITEDWQFISLVLQTYLLYKRHSAVNYGEYLKEVLLKWQVQNNHDVVTVTDNASNINDACEEAGCKCSVKYFAHSLNLASQKVFKLNTPYQISVKFRKVATYFHKNAEARILQENQTKLGLPQHKLIHYFATLKKKYKIYNAKEVIKLWTLHRTLYWFEISNFKKLERISTDENPWTWWAKKEVMFPLLSNVARQILGILATSISAE